MRFRRWFEANRGDALWLALVLAAVTLVWCGHYGRWTATAWKTPILYSADERSGKEFSGDALWGLAATKAMATGEIAPLVPKHPHSLGAPYVAQWSDYPTNEEGITAWWALLAKLFGLFRGSNLVLLSGHLAAATSFYVVCRYLRYRAIFGALGAILFALSRYAFWRGLPHLTLLFYWHIPLALLVLSWCVRGEPLRGDRRKLWFCAAVAVAHGLQNPYYTGIFIQLLFAAACYAWFRWREWQRLQLPVFIVAVVAVTFLVVNLDTFIYRAAHGANPNAAERVLSDVERYGLKPVELFLPYTHSLEFLQTISRSSYFKQTIYLGEAGSAYLGLIGVAALVWLFGSALLGVVHNQIRLIPVHFWGVLWTLFFAVVGGVTTLFAIFNFPFLRSSNRYSIVVLAALLLFLVRELSRVTARWQKKYRTALASAMLVIGIYDQVPPGTVERDARSHAAMLEDEQLVAAVEKSLPPDAMVFQLPVQGFPEVPAVGAMSDYENFRPYLHSHHLRFSYGTVKGRFLERWQGDAAQLGAAYLVRTLERYGFSAVLINRKGYEDRAGALQQELRDAGSSRVLAWSRDFLCLALNPVTHPELPPIFGAGWYHLEGDDKFNRRWSAGKATLLLHNRTTAEQKVDLNFGLAVLNERRVKISSGGQTLYDSFVEPEHPVRSVELNVKLRPGDNTIDFTTDRPAEFPTNGDKRKLAFNVTNFSILQR